MGNYFVSCIEKTPKNFDKLITFVSNGEAYCSHGTDKIWCNVAVLIA